MAAAKMKQTAEKEEEFIFILLSFIILDRIPS